MVKVNIMVFGVITTCTLVVNIGGTHCFPCKRESIYIGVERGEKKGTQSQMRR
jgi:hypothetical protein